MSSPRKTVVPAIPQVGRSQAEVDAVLKASKEAIEVAYGRRGDPLDRFVTVRELGDAGIAGTILGKGGATLTAPDPGSNGGAPIFDPGAPDIGSDDFTVPLAPTGVAARGVGPDSIMVTWNPPDYANHEFAEIFCVPQAAIGVVPSFVFAAPGFVTNKPVSATNPHPQFVGVAGGTIFTHRDLVRFVLPGQDPLDAALNPPLRYYFVRFVSTAGVPGPYAPLNGAAGRMVVDERATLTAMIGNVTGSAAYANLMRGYLNTNAFDPVLAAGGVQTYIQQQDVAVRNTINAQLVRLIGISDQAAGSQTLIQRIDTTTGVANAAAANVNNLQLWQAALNRSGTGQGSSGSGVNAFTDFVASVYRNVFVSVDANSALAQAIDVVDARIGPPGAFEDTVFATTQVLSQADATINGELNSLWSVRMAQDDGTGLRRMAGFGLSLERTLQDDGTFRDLSSFLVNANQFAVMGAASKSGAVILGFSTLSFSNTATFTLKTAAHGFVVADPPAPGDPFRADAVLSVPDDAPRAADGQPAQTNPLAPFAGAECVVTAVNGVNVTVRRLDNGSFGPARTLAIAPEFGNALMSALNIPFIIDTERQVVGIRGQLVVDGLVRATRGDFNELTAQSAFIQQLQAEVVNANVVIGQRLIAGTPGSGALTADAYAAISNYIVELNNPIGDMPPMRYWKPSTGHTVFQLDQLGNLLVGGNLSVGNNATIATSGDNVCSMGGAGADGTYALWVGPRAYFGPSGSLRDEARGVFWIKDNGRAGFNADLFLGANALSLPTMAAADQAGSATTIAAGGLRALSLVEDAVTSSSITIRSLRSGLAPVTWITVSGQLAGMEPGAGGSSDDKRFDIQAELVGNPAGTGGSGILIQHIEMDDYDAETWPFTLSAALQVPAGTYWVRLTVRNLESGKRKMSIIRGWNAIAMQVTAGGGLVA